MAKRQLPDGMIQRGKVYWTDFRANGRRVRKSLSTNYKTAKQLLIELRARTERGDYGLLDNEVLIGELRGEYLKHCGQTKKSGTVERCTTALAAIAPCMPRRVSAMTIQRVVAYREQRLAAGISPGTVNLEVGTLGSMLNWAVKYQIVGSNPIKGIEKLPHDHPKEGRALSDSEVSALLDHSPQRHADVWYCLLVTGMRVSELASLRFSDVDWEAREVVVQRGVAKNHKARRIPIDNGLSEILAQRRETRGEQNRVFLAPHGGVTRRQSVYKAFIRCCVRAGIQTRTVDSEGREVDHVDVHSLRRTFATNLIVNGTDPKTVQELLGHRTLDMTMRLYAKIQTGTKRQAVAKLSYGKGTEAPEHVVDFRAG